MKNIRSSFMKCFFHKLTYIPTIEVCLSTVFQQAAAPHRALFNSVDSWFGLLRWFMKMISHIPIFVEKCKVQIVMFKRVRPLRPGLRSRSQDGSSNRSESIVFAGVGVGAGTGKNWPTPTPARSRTPIPGNRRWFWANSYAPSRKHW